MQSMNVSVNRQLFAAQTDAHESVWQPPTTITTATMIQLLLYVQAGGGGKTEIGRELRATASKLFPDVELPVGPRYLVRKTQVCVETIQVMLSIHI